jgi:hypothetical protein
MQSLRSLVAGKRYRSRDLIGILLALAVGISGQLFLADPLKILAPSLPVLSPADWQGSQDNREPIILSGSAWNEKRSFQQSIVLIKNQKPVASATQIIVWYADLTQTKAAWNQHKREPYYDFPIIARGTNEDEPASLLFCGPPVSDTPGECAYRAYWGHWYTQVTFYGGNSEDFPLSEMRKLTDRIDQLLMSAPDKPCQGFFCK